MTDLRRWFRGIADNAMRRLRTAATRPQSDASPPSASMGRIIRFAEVSDGAFFAGDLFRRKFGALPPAEGRHFVAFYRASGEGDVLRCVGYVHQMPFGDSFLTGGFCIDETAYRHMTASDRVQLRGEGGLSERLLRFSIESLPEAVAFWGYVGNAQARKVDLRVGFEALDHDHLMVIWNQSLSPREKRERSQAVKAIGPF